MKHLEWLIGWLLITGGFFLPHHNESSISRRNIIILKYSHNALIYQALSLNN